MRKSDDILRKELGIMSVELAVNAKVTPELDPGFVPAVLWNRAFRAKVEADAKSLELRIGLQRPDGTCFVHETKVLSHEGSNQALNVRYIERLIKFLLWQKGGSRIFIGGCAELGVAIAEIYSEQGERKFDVELIGEKIYGEKITVKSCELSEVPVANEEHVTLGGYTNGCRIGFELGGSDRKCAAMKDGEILFSEEIRWDPYFEKNPHYHYEGIQKSLKKAASYLPKVDSIGGSSAGVYVNNEVRVASLFRGVSPEDFEEHVRDIFFRLKKEWNDIPFEVVNDGEVTALAGAMSLKATALLGISMGTSLAAGYCDPNGHLTSWLNELAFAPVDFREGAPIDEWSQDHGCGVQYFSQQAVARLVSAAGIDVPADMLAPEVLVIVQDLMAKGDKRAESIYRTIGVYFGYTIAHYADLFELSDLLILGRVTSGTGGDLILSIAQEILKDEFPELTIKISTPNEADKRHGQAVAAATLPFLAE